MLSKRYKSTEVDRRTWIRTRILFSSSREKVKNVAANQRPGRLSLFSGRPKNTNLVEDIEILLPVEFRWIPFSGRKREKLTTTDGWRTTRDHNNSALGPSAQVH